MHPFGLFPFGFWVQVYLFKHKLPQLQKARLYEAAHTHLGLAIAFLEHVQDQAVDPLPMGGPQGLVTALGNI